MNLICTSYPLSKNMNMPFGLMTLLGVIFLCLPCHTAPMEEEIQQLTIMAYEDLFECKCRLAGEINNSFNTGFTCSDPADMLCRNLFDQCLCYPKKARLVKRGFLSACFGKSKVKEDDPFTLEQTGALTEKDLAKIKDIEARRGRPTYSDAENELFDMLSKGSDGLDDFIKEKYGITDDELEDIRGWTAWPIPSMMHDFVPGIEKLPKYRGVAFRRTSMLSLEDRAKYMPNFKPEGEVDAGYMVRYDKRDPSKQSIAMATSAGDFDVNEKMFGDWALAIESPHGHDITVFNTQGESELIFTKNSKFRVLGIDEVGKRAWLQEITE